MLTLIMSWRRASSNKTTVVILVVLSCQKIQIVPFLDLDQLLQTEVTYWHYCIMSKFSQQVQTCVIIDFGVDIVINLSRV